MLSELVEFDHDNDNFTGRIPAELACMTKLVEIDLTDNDLEGTLHFCSLHTILVHIGANLLYIAPI